MFQNLWSISSIENYLLVVPHGGNVGQKGLRGAPQKDESWIPKKDEIWNDGVYMRQLHH